MNPQVPLGESVPPNTRYAVSVSLPTWEDNVDYEKGIARVVDRMVGGYPRFFIARSIQKLVTMVKDRFALPSESAMLFPSQKCAERCAAFIYDQASKQHTADAEFALPRAGQVRIVTHVVEPINKKAAALDATSDALQTPVTIYCVFFPADLFPLAKQYWQHTGDGISARLADHCLRIAQVNEQLEQTAGPLSPFGSSSASRRKQGSGYHRTASAVASPLPSPSPSDGPATTVGASVAAPEALATAEDDVLSPEASIEADTYVEERFGRNLSLKYTANMKAALRRRIAGALSEEEQKQGAQVERGVAGLSADDVYIATTGMGAVFQVHQALLRVGRGKSVCFGFPYTDTLKILQKFGPGAYFLGQGEGSDYDELERILERHSQSTEEDSILAIFTECPSNPLLKTADLARLRELADRHGAALVVDETIGSFPNVDVLSWADVVVSSLTKVFSGDSNVMGGSIVLNPNRAHYARLRQTMDAEFEDLLWCEDAVFLERNSRDFMSRVPRINANALAVAEMLAASPKVAQVNYPKFTTAANYELIRRSTADAGYGGLLSVDFVGGEEASRAFYNGLACCKGPSLGTNFTLASPYTILAHFTELDWAARYGVSPYLVRISIGLEPCDELLAMFQKALDAIPA
ncbi:Cystathionine gamma-synthase [Coemansia sp. RSA 1722]|nr:Cystathionine gamma-synthase [Coemansia sp. RSA 486]KAJ2237817.1 Cystathionine gamma-synthase [Coemansia sp. RSA 485]KAJ2603245.1 Cystathionine gamma-synthase [Coemansia sp. RSA 1721]KAJ2605874.1 Cystathionine gamma-synthase [Coemansia sp. RSA 1722]KAJ2639965.1 Cystathionine gamma-synthase [Coemansia sp. RSA 1286]